jgi:hypothetical protein
MVYCQDFSMIIMLFSWKIWESCTKRSDNNIEFRNLDDKNTVFVEKKVLATLQALPRYATLVTGGNWSAGEAWMRLTELKMKEYWPWLSSKQS